MKLKTQKKIAIYFALTFEVTFMILSTLELIPNLFGGAMIISGFIWLIYLSWNFEETQGEEVNHF